MENLKKLSVLCAASAMTLGCVNTEYDLDKQIVTEATLFEKISVPVGSLGQITIDDILFADDNEMIRTNADGDYFMDFTTGKFDSQVEIPSFSIEGMRLEDQIIHFSMPSYLVGMSTNGLDRVIRYSDIIPGGLAFNMDIEVDSPLPSELVSVSEVHLDGSMTCNFTLNTGKLFVSKGFELDFPEYLTIVKASTSTKYDVVDGHILRFLADSEVSASSPLSVEVKLNKLMLPKDAIQVQGDSRRVVINDNVGIKGDFYLQTKDFPQIPDEVLITLHVGVEDLSVTKAKVSLDLTTDIPSEEIILGELPDILEGNEIVVDLYNPYINLEINNMSPFGFYVAGDITAYNSSDSYNIHIGGDGSASSSDEEIFVFSNSMKQFYFSRREMNDIPSGATNITIPGIAEMIKDIPERIIIHDMTINPIADEVMIDAGASYKVAVDYTVSSPLAFDEEFNLMFTQTIEDLALTFDEVKVESAQLRMEIVNTIPVAFSIEADCIDSSGKALPNVKLSMDKSIAAGSLENPSVTPVSITLTNKKGALDVDGLNLTMKASSSSSEFAGICLNKKQGFEIRNIVLALPDGVGVEF